MGPNRQSKPRSDAPRSSAGGRGGRGGGESRGRGRGGAGGGGRRTANVPAGVGMNEAHRNMLVDVLRHVATGGTSSVSDAHFDHRRNAIVFQRNRPLTRLEMAQVVFERLGF